MSTWDDVETMVVINLVQQFGKQLRVVGKQACAHLRRVPALLASNAGLGRLPGHECGGDSDGHDGGKPGNRHRDLGIEAGVSLWFLISGMGLALLVFRMPD
jgi:hypothetical protein